MQVTLETPYDLGYSTASKALDRKFPGQGFGSLVKQIIADCPYTGPEWSNTREQWADGVKDSIIDHTVNKQRKSVR